jgi:hypothetical protein
MIISDPNSLEANSYVSLIEAEIYAGSRLSTAAWDALSNQPSATGWTLASSQLAGATTIPLTGGVGTFQVGNVVSIDGTYYSITDVTVPTSPIIAPPLVANVSSGTAFIRITLSEKEKALTWATAMLDVQVTWDGDKKSVDQPLAWPRSGVQDCDGNTFPDNIFPKELKNATAELALSLAGRDSSATPSLLGLGLKSAKVAEIEVEADKSMVVDAVPNYVQDMIACFGTSKSVGGSGMVRLVRV